MAIAYTNLIRQKWQANLADALSDPELPEYKRKVYKEALENDRKKTIQSIALDEDEGVWEIWLWDENSTQLGGGTAMYLSCATGEFLGKRTGE